MKTIKSVLERVHDIRTQINGNTAVKNAVAAYVKRSPTCANTSGEVEAHKFNDFSDWSDKGSYPFDKWANWSDFSKK